MAKGEQTMWTRLGAAVLAAGLSLATVADAKDKDKGEEKEKGKVGVELQVSAPSLLVAPAGVTLSANAWSDQANHPVVRVEYYQGSTLLGTAGTAPYTLPWAGVAAGNYTLTAQAINDKGDVAVSAPVEVSVDAPPTVALTGPGRIVTAPATLPLTAQAADSDGSIAQVEFYQGSTRIGTAISAPYTITWANVPAGTYTLTATVTDDRGAATTSAPIQVRVNAPPAVTLATPANGVPIAPASLPLTADASDADGSIAQVAFYQGNTLIGTATSAPYAVTWANAPAGTYTLTAQATDNDGAVTVSAPIPVRVDAPPTVVLTSPATGQTLIAPANVTMTAQAADTDGTVARVEFYQGNTLVGTATAAPYAVTWANVPAGSYTLTAKAIDNDGAATTSALVALRVDAPPTVAITSPAANSVAMAPASVTVTANAADADGNITQVAFYQGSTLIGTATSAPYTVTWANVPAGSYTLTAQATDNDGAVTASAPVPVRVDAPPTVALTSPASGQTLVALASLTLTATAADTDGSVAQVAFYQGGTLIGTATSAPYAVTWANVPAGSYTLTAQATDNDGAATISAAVAVTVMPNQPPSVTLTSPVAGQGYTAPASVTLMAHAADGDGTVVRVEFYQGGTLLGMVGAAPYALAWANVAEGNYTVTAKAYDDKGGETISAPVVLAVASAKPKLYYLHSDHLNTPRLVTDVQARVVWRRGPLDEPFGLALPEEDPDGNGVPFTLNLRFPGQYYDLETQTNYNYFRDYDPATGRYLQSDPIGLVGGINTYLYVGANPLSFTDPLGLIAGVAAAGSTGAAVVGGGIGGSSYGMSSASSSTGHPALDSALGGRIDPWRDTKTETRTPLCFPKGPDCEKMLRDNLNRCQSLFPGTFLFPLRIGCILMANNAYRRCKAGGDRSDGRDHSDFNGPDPSTFGG